jgi:hypothetical protein
MKIVKYLTTMSLVIALASCGSDESPTTDAASTDPVGTETETETEPVAAAAGAMDGSVLGGWELEVLEMPGMKEMMAGMAGMAGEGEDTEAAIAAAEAEVDEMIAKMLEDATLEVNEDGSVIMTMVNMQTGESESKTGTWAMSEDSKTFTMTLDNQAQAMEVYELSADKFAFGVAEQGMSIKMTWSRS